MNYPQKRGLSNLTSVKPQSVTANSTVRGKLRLGLKWRQKLGQSLTEELPLPHPPEKIDPPPLSNKC
jgi:hypothetical protein